MVSKKSIAVSEKSEECGWFLCQKGDEHVQFISVVLDVIGVMVRKLIILRMILK